MVWFGDRKLVSSDGLLDCKVKQDLAGHLESTQLNRYAKIGLTPTFQAVKQILGCSETNFPTTFYSSLEPSAEKCGHPKASSTGLNVEHARWVGIVSSTSH